LRRSDGLDVPQAAGDLAVDPAVPEKEWGASYDQRRAVVWVWVKRRRVAAWKKARAGAEWGLPSRQKWIKMGGAGIECGALVK